MPENDPAGFRPMGTQVDPGTSTGSPSPQGPEGGSQSKSPEGGAQTREFDFTQFGEEFNSVDSVKAFIETSRGYKSKIEELEGRINSTPTSPAYADESLFKLDYVKRNNPDKFDLAKNLLFGNIGDMDLIRLNLEFDDPVLQALDEDDKRAYLESKYQLSHSLKPLSTEDGFSEEEVAAREQQIAAEERRIKAVNVSLKIDADRARKNIQDKLFGGVQVPVYETPEQAEARIAEAATKISASWVEPLREVEKLTEVTINTWNSKDNAPAPLFNMKIEPEDLKKYTDEFMGHALQNGWTPDAISVNDVRSFIETRFREDNLPKIIHDASVRARNMSNEEWQKYIFNPQQSAKPVSVPDGGRTGRTTQESFARALKQ